MPYEIDISSYGLSAHVPVVGWFAALPFDFSGPSPDGSDSGGEILAYWEHLLVLVHLMTSREYESTFRKESARALADTRDLELRVAGAQNSSLVASEVKLDRIHSQQSIGESSTLWVYRGAISGTGIKWSPPPHSFKTWGHEGDQEFGWKGELPDTQSRLSYARFDWDNGRYFQAADLAGPCGIHGMGSLANTILRCCKPYSGNPPKPTQGTVVPELSLKDGNRDGRGMELLGSEVAGVAQVQGARGALWLAQGSLAAMAPRQSVGWARGCHPGEKKRDHTVLLGDMPLVQTMRLKAGDEHEEPSNNTSDLVFEGLSLWDLKHRGADVDPVLL